MLLLVAALFSGAVAGGMAAIRLSEPEAPPDDEVVEVIRSQLRLTPDNEALKELLRREDLRARRSYLAHRRRLQVGAVLLLIGLLVTVAAAQWHAALDPKPVRPSDPVERQDADRWLASRGRQMAAVGAVGLAGALALILAGILGGVELPGPTKEDGTVGAGPGPDAGGPSAPEPAAFKENWPRFRGPTGMGIVRAGPWPTSWNVETGENIVWKTAVPAPGNSSPVVWGNRIFLTGGSEKRQEVLCFERTSGRLLWRTPVAAQRSADLELEVMAETGHAAPTPATDGERLYVTFASSDIAALDFDGRIVWARNLGKPVNAYGRATSLLVHKDTVILQFDRGVSEEEKLSYLLALEGATGKEAWRTPRPVGNSWSTPVVAAIGEDRTLLTCAAPWTIAYEPDSGAELWRAQALSGDVAPSPVYADGLVFVTNEYAKAVAIRVGGSGDVTKTHLAWTAEEGLSDASSPIATDRLFLQAQSSGYITCYDAKKGHLIWEHQLDGGVWASPTLVGHLVYLPSEDGKVYLFELGEKYVPRGACNLGEPLFATPAFVDDQIIFRGKKHLFCIGRRAEGP